MSTGKMHNDAQRCLAGKMNPSQGTTRIGVDITSFEILDIWLVMIELTDIQRQVFEFISDKLVAGDPAPTLREVAVKFGWRSKRAAECHIEALVRKRWLSSEPGKARSLRVISPLAMHKSRIVDIPLFGSIPAGYSNERQQEPDGCVSVDIESIGFKPTRNTFALRVVGDSMIGKHICDGDIAVLEHGPEPRSGQIVAALIDRKSTLKTFVIRDGRPFLKAENPKYPDFIASEELVIQGVFRALIRKARE
jgi:repressor LexA